ncbi:MAG: ABC transporter permease [Chloroflexi bacterium]|nr:ABC transporter permease [Chloroflexota bacterium]
MSSGAWTTLTNPDLWQATLRDGTPLALAAVGGVISERSGVVNIAMEGMMLTGCLASVYFSIHMHNALAGLVAAMVAGGILALAHAFAAIRLKADQIVIGMAINLLALGLTSYLNFSIWGQNGAPGACTPSSGPCQPGQILTIPDWSIPGAANITFLGIGKILFQQSPIVYLMLLLVLLAHVFLFRTKLGLRIRAVGEHPRAADTAGINVQRLRYLSVVLSGLLSGLAGGYLALAVAYTFTNNMTAGLGFIALAAMIFGKWTPFGAFGACLLFGFGSALHDILQNTSGPLQDYSTLLATLPYVLTIVALAGFIGRAIPPAADGQPYDPAEAA